MLLKRFAVGLLFVSALFPLSATAEVGMSEKIEVTIVGEVVNSICYLDHNGKGVEHKSCAEKATQSGLALAVLEDDTEFLYLAVTPDQKPATVLLQPYLAQRVQVQGKLMEGNGLTVIEVDKVTPVAS